MSVVILDTLDTCIHTYRHAYMHPSVFRISRDPIGSNKLGVRSAVIRVGFI